MSVRRPYLERSRDPGAARRAGDSLRDPRRWNPTDFLSAWLPESEGRGPSRRGAMAGWRTRPMERWNSYNCLRLRLFMAPFHRTPYGRAICDLSVLRKKRRGDFRRSAFRQRPRRRSDGRLHFPGGTSLARPILPESRCGWRPGGRSPPSDRSSAAARHGILLDSTATCRGERSIPTPRMEALRTHSIAQESLLLQCTAG